MAGQPAALTGLSGSAVQAVVHKFPAGPGEEARQKFWGEIGKQQVLAHLGVGPPVLRATPYEYVRPYVPGVTLEEYLQTHPDKALAKAEELLALCVRLADAPATGAAEVFAGYVRRLLQSVWLYLPAGLLAAYGDLLQALTETAWPVPVLGFSHGDLNFQNIIVDPDGRMWLIDPLLNAYDTPWWDVGKLLQSTYVDWAQVRNGRVARPPDHLRAMAGVFLEGREHQGRFFLFLVLLRILRHAPSDAVQRAVLIEAFRTGWEYVRTS